MRNPFEYGNVVGQKSFCNRREELARLKRGFENGERLFLYSDRRLGKTSLIKLALGELPSNSYIAVYADLWATNSEGEFALALAKALTQGAATTTTKLLSFAKDFFASLRPAVTTDDEGKARIVFGVSKDNLSLPTLDEVLEAVPQIAKRSGKQIVIALDEFQQIAEYKTDAAERCLRSAIQHHKGVAYLFSGSRKHLIQKMFLDKERPLYRSAAHFQLQPIEEKHWVPFIKNKFVQSDKFVEDDLIKRLCQFSEGHPFYTQHLCHALWELTEPNQAHSTVTAPQQKTLDKAVMLVLQQENYAFTILWDALPSNQKILLSAIANSLSDFQPFSAQFVKHSGLGSASNVQRAAQGLFMKDLIERNESGSFTISDRFLKLWLRRDDVSRG